MLYKDKTNKKHKKILAKKIKSLPPEIWLFEIMPFLFGNRYDLFNLSITAKFLNNMVQLLPIYHAEDLRLSSDKKISIFVNFLLPYKFRTLGETWVSKIIKQPNKLAIRLLGNEYANNKEFIIAIEQTITQKKFASFFSKMTSSINRDYIMTLAIYIWDKDKCFEKHLASFKKHFVSLKEYSSSPFYAKYSIIILKAFLPLIPILSENQIIKLLKYIKPLLKNNSILTRSATNKIICLSIARLSKKHTTPLLKYIIPLFKNNNVEISENAASLLAKIIISYSKKSSVLLKLIYDIISKPKFLKKMLCKIKNIFDYKALSYKKERMVEIFRAVSVLILSINVLPKKEFNTSLGIIRNYLNKNNDDNQLKLIEIINKKIATLAGEHTGRLLQIFKIIRPLLKSKTIKIRLAAIEAMASLAKKLPDDKKVALSLLIKEVLFKEKNNRVLLEVIIQINSIKRIYKKNSPAQAWLMKILPKNKNTNTKTVTFQKDEIKKNKNFVYGSQTINHQDSISVFLTIIKIIASLFNQNNEVLLNSPVFKEDICHLHNEILPKVLSPIKLLKKSNYQKARLMLIKKINLFCDKIYKIKFNKLFYALPPLLNNDDIDIILVALDKIPPLLKKSTKEFYSTPPECFTNIEKLIKNISNKYCNHEIILSKANMIIKLLKNEKYNPAIKIAQQNRFFENYFKDVSEPNSKTPKKGFY
jgi:hypothetical protein